jgi:hypothetical protein
MRSPSLQTPAVTAGPRRWRTLSAHNGRVRLHLHTSQVLWDRGYRHYSVAHDLTRWQALKLGLRLIWHAS